MTLAKFDFHTLLPDLILDALDSVGLRVDSGLTALNSYENRVYQFIAEDRLRYVVKFYRPERWEPAQIQEEHDFAQTLSHQEIPIVAPLKLNHQTLQVYQGFMFAVFPSVGGRAYETDNLDQFEWVARFLGRIHQVGKQGPFVARPTIGLDEYLYQPRHCLAASALVSEKVKAPLLEALDALIVAVEQHWHTDWLSCRLHGDCHAGNILWRDGPTFVDLDDARNGPAIQDIWMLLQGTRQEQRQQLDVFIDAYSEFTEFDLRELALIEPLRAMRMVYYLAWVVRRFNDPAFPRSFPWFTDIDFWQQQASLFLEQIKVLQAPPLQLTPMY